MKDLQLWAGMECTLNRVGDRYRDQIELTGHAMRPDDVDRIVDLGVTTIRHPILWEKVAPRGVAHADWRWVDARMQAYRDRGLRVVAGLVHHGSGPPGTSLLDPSFADDLAAFAGAVAARYPFLVDFTPVNEPLTTARFSALYGHWYPHRRDVASFLRALVIQIEATRAAMESIRLRTPAARLVQTEDIGRITATRDLAYQAAYENERRWLSLDLLTGRVDRDHPLAAHLLEHGVPLRTLQSLVERPCPPDLVGVNYYVTSDRHLDDRLALHATSPVGGNGRHRYVDVEAVRAEQRGIVGHRVLLEEVWARYGIPLAVTESHLGCDPEEQIRWLRESWEGALQARASGVLVEAVTLWSVFGAYDWDSLVTQERGHYEPGAFDVRGPVPRPTAVAHAARDLARTGRVDHPLAGGAGWWRRPERLLPWFRGQVGRAAAPAARVVVVGRGAIASALVQACRRRHFECRVIPRDASGARVAAAIGDIRPWLVIDTLGEACDEQRAPEAAQHVAIARACHATGARLLVVSGADVFRGDKASAYEETDPVGPTCALGLVRARAEQLVREVVEGSVVVRAGLLFGEGEERGLFDRARTPAREDDADVLVSITHLPDFAHRCLDLAVDGATGVWHLAHEGARTMEEWRTLGSEVLGRPRRVVELEPPGGIGRPILQRGLQSSRWSPLPDAPATLERYLRELAHRERAPATASGF